MFLDLVILSGPEVEFVRFRSFAIEPSSTKGFNQ
jgi:hypothetical protein